MALYEVALEQLFCEKPHLLAIGCKTTEDILQAFTGAEKSNRSESVRLAPDHLRQVLYEDFFHQFEAWETEKSSYTVFKSVMNYLHRVESILFFVAASRNSDLALHLEAGEALSKLFFAFDRIKYKRLWPHLIADMQELKTVSRNIERTSKWKPICHQKCGSFCFPRCRPCL